MTIRKKHRVRLAIVLTVTVFSAMIGPDIFHEKQVQASRHETVTPGEGEPGVLRYAVWDGAAARVQKNSAAASKSVEVSESQINTDINTLGSTMTSQIESYVNSATYAGSMVQSTDASERYALNTETGASFEDLYTKVIFQIPNTSMPQEIRALFNDSSKHYLIPKKTLFYVEQAISRYPALCCLHTTLRMSMTSTTTTLTVYSPVQINEFKSSTLAYQDAINEILKTPQRNTGMSVADKFLYLHDEVAAITEYSLGRNGRFAYDYTPVGAVLQGLAVCQGYAAVFNQLAKKLNLESYVLDSDTHAWNIVKVNGSWYYIDATWDDTKTLVGGKDEVKHNYVLVNSSEAANTSFSNGHTCTGDYVDFSANFTRYLGTGYGSNYFPRTEAITTQMGYSSGGFFYSKDNRVCHWNPTTNRKTPYSNFPSATQRRVSVLNDTVYISGSDGMYNLQFDTSQLYRVDSNVYSGMYEAANVLYVSRNGEAYTIYKSEAASGSSTMPPSSSIPPVSSPGTTIGPQVTTAASASPGGIPTVPPSPTSTIYDPTLVTPTPTSSAASTATATPGGSGTFTAPPKTSIKKLTNVKKRSAYLSWKRSGGASQYQVWYTTSSNFSKDKHIRTSLTSSVTIANLFKNKTYYFKVRSVKIKRVDGEIRYKYSGWSAKKKLKIKK